MSLFVQEEEKLTDLVCEKGTRLIETLEIDTLYFIKSHLYYNALWSRLTASMILSQKSESVSQLGKMGF